MACAVLLLDVMGTVLRDPYLGALTAVLGDMTAGRNTLDLEAMLRFEEGRISESEYVERFFLDRRTLDAAAFKLHLSRNYTWLPGMEQLLGELHDRSTVMHALSDYSEWYSLADQATSLSRYLPWTFVSCKTGICKPAPEAFLGAASALGVTPDACLLVDDKASNCAAARAIGMNAVQFSDAVSLRDELAAYAFL